MADLHDAGMVAGLGLADDVVPPRRHDIEDAGEADAEHGRPSLRPPIVRRFIDMMSPTAVRNAKTEPTSGHGLGLTRW